MTDKIFDKALQKQITDADQQQSINRNTRPVASELITAFAKTVLTIVREHLLRDGFVRVHHFGTFRLKVGKARKVYNPQTRQSVLQEPKARVVFTPAKALKEQIEPHPLPVQPIQALRREQIRPAPPNTLKPISVPTAIGARISLGTGNAVNTKRTSDDIDHETLSKSAVVASLLKTNIQEPDTLSTRSIYPAEKTRCTYKPPSETETLRQLRQISDTRKPSGLEPEPVIPIETEYRHDDDWEVESLSKRQAADDLLPLTQASSTQRSKSLSNHIRNRVITAVLAVLLAVALIFWMYPNSGKDTRHVNSASPVSATPEPIVLPSIPKPHIEDTANNEISATEVDNSTSAIPVEETVGIEPIAEYTPVATHDTPVSNAPFFPKTQYQIRNGDNLWGLSRKNYLNPFLWPHIYRANYAQLASPDLLEVRNTITLPTLQGSPAELALIDHHNIAEGYFLLYQHYKKIGHSNPHHALIGVKWFAPDVLTTHQSEIDPLDISKLNSKRKDNVLIQSALSRSAP